MFKPRQTCLTTMNGKKQSYQIRVFHYKLNIRRSNDRVIFYNENLIPAKTAYIFLRSPGCGDGVQQHISLAIEEVVKHIHNDHDGVSNHQPHGCILNCLFRRRSKKTSKLRATGLCAGKSPGPGNSPHKGPVTREMFPFNDVMMYIHQIYAMRPVATICSLYMSWLLLHLVMFYFSLYVGILDHHCFK